MVHKTVHAGNYPRSRMSFAQVRAWEIMMMFARSTVTIILEVDAERKQCYDLRLSLKKIKSQVIGVIRMIVLRIKESM